MQLAVSESTPLLENVLAQEYQARLEVPDHPYGRGSVALSFAATPLEELTFDQFSSAWKLRCYAQRLFAHFDSTGTNCIGVYTPKKPYKEQLIPFYVDSSSWLSCISIKFKQLQIIYRTLIANNAASSIHDREVLEQMVRQFPYREQVAVGEEAKTGRGALIEPHVLARQRVWEGSFVNVLFHFAPLNLGSESLHFMIVPKGEEPARTALELSQEQYREMMHLQQVICRYYTTQRTVVQGLRALRMYVYDKQNVGQTQEVFHRHVVAVFSQEDVVKGVFALFTQMFWGQKLLSDRELEHKVEKAKVELTEFFDESAEEAACSSDEETGFICVDWSAIGSVIESSQGDSKEAP